MLSIDKPLIQQKFVSSWTEAIFLRAANHWIAGMSCGRIAIELNHEFKTEFTRNAVIGKLQREGIPARHPRRVMDKIPKAKPVRRLPNGLLTPFTPAKPRVIDFFSLVSLDALTSEQCRYPHGDGPFLFCGQPRMQESQYCRTCHRLCYQRAA